MHKHEQKWKTLRNVDDEMDELDEYEGPSTKHPDKIMSQPVAWLTTKSIPEVP